MFKALILRQQQPSLPPLFDLDMQPEAVFLQFHYDFYKGSSRSDSIHYLEFKLIKLCKYESLVYTWKLSFTLAAVVATSFFQCIF